MDDSNPSEALTQQLKMPDALTGEQSGALPEATSQTKEDAFRLGQTKVLEMIAANAPLSEILTRLVLLIEAQSPGMLCSVLLLSRDGNHIRHGAAPSLPENYVKAIDGEPIGPKHGSCGTAMYRGDPVVVTDISTDPLWEDYREIAAANDLRACWSTPIMSGRGKVLGSFAMYYREPRTPTGDEAALTDVATKIAGLAIEHQLARETLTRTKNELAQATENAELGEIAAALASELRHPVEAMVNNADKCLQMLNEGKSDAAPLREALTKIAADGRRTLQLIAEVRARTDI